MKLYLLVTQDELELPLIVADSIKELAVKCGCTENAISVGISYKKNGGKSRFVKVVVEDD
jgi:hypothetical protein